MRSTRGGLGGIYIKSAGNSFRRFRIRDAEGNIVNACSELSRTLNVGCVLANVDALNNVPATIVVASVDATGKRASYSSSGSALWISGLGGEFGYQRRFSPNAAQTASPRPHRSSTIRPSSPSISAAAALATMWMARRLKTRLPAAPPGSTHPATTAR